MKKTLLFSLLLMFLKVTSSYSQFVPSSYPDELYPTIPNFPNGRINHMSSFAYFNNNVKYEVWGWNSEVYGSGVPATIAWRVNDPVIGTAVNGTIDPAPFATALPLELEVVTYASNGDVYLVAAYYCATSFTGTGIGHYYNVYKWDPSSTSYVTVSIANQLSTATKYGRISMDAFKGYAIGFVWQDMEKIYAKTGLVDPVTGVMTMSNSILVRNANGILPDISFGVSTGNQPLFRIVYLSSNIVPSMSNLNVSHIDFMTFHTFTGLGITFPIDNVWSTNYDYSLWGPNLHNNKYDFTMAYFNIDCPTTGNVLNADLWTVAYNDNLTNIKARISSNFGINTIDVTSFDPLTIAPTDLNSFPNVVYGTNDLMYFAWHYNAWAPNTRYVALVTDQTGVPASNIYLSVSNYLPMPNRFNSLITLAKEPHFTGEIFSAFTTQDATSLIQDVVTKSVPIGSTSFKPTSVTNVDLVEDIVIYPNPFFQSFTIETNDKSLNYSVSISDITGKMIFLSHDKMESINVQLKNASGNFVSGCYFVSVKSGNMSKSYKLVKL